MDCEPCKLVSPVVRMISPPEIARFLGNDITAVNRLANEQTRPVAQAN